MAIHQNRQSFLKERSLEGKCQASFHFAHSFELSEQTPGLTLLIYQDVSLWEMTMHQTTGKERGQGARQHARKFQQGTKAQSLLFHSIGLSRLLAQLLTTLTREFFFIVSNQIVLCCQLPVDSQELNRGKIASLFSQAMYSC